MAWEWILGAALVAVAGIAALQYRTARGQHRPLAQRQPQRQTPNTPDLGMEAIDMAEIRRTQSRNDSLERPQTLWGFGQGTRNTASTNVQPLADDETYAKRFHAAFMKNKD